MPKINQEEYEILKELDDKWKWIARDKDGEAFMYESEPYRIETIWNFDDGLHNPLRGNLFQFIQWKNEEPYNIAELIREYLHDNQPKLFIDGQEQSFGFKEESEEKEVKDLEWVKAKLKKDHKDGEVAKSQIKDGEKIDGIDLNSYWRGRQTANYIARCYLEDLDEPETLSQEWIDENKREINEFGGPVADYVSVGDLENLIVEKPKENEVIITKPEIPQFIENTMDKYDSLQEMLTEEYYNGSGGEIYDDEVFQWIDKNFELLVKARLFGYTVKEEPKYTVYIEAPNSFGSENCLYLYKNPNNKIRSGINKFDYDKTKERYQLTEQEIKEYAPDFWAIAEKVDPNDE